MTSREDFKVVQSALCSPLLNEKAGLPKRDRRGTGAVMTETISKPKIQPLRPASFLLFGGVLPAIMVGLDQLSKWATTRSFDQPLNVCEISNPNFTHEISPIMDITLLCNRGISWGLMQGDSSIKRWGLTIFAFVMVAVLLFVLRRTTDRLGQISLSFVIGGAIGNAIDRLLFGAVTDMIDFSDVGFKFVFNIADSFITVGVIGLFLSSWLVERRLKRASVKDNAA